MKQFDGLQSLQQPLSGLPQWVSERILQQINQLTHYEPVIGIMGKTGAGKSSLCNALFAGDISPVSDVAACTRKPLQFRLQLGKRFMTIMDLTPDINLPHFARQRAGLIQEENHAENNDLCCTRPHSVTCCIQCRCCSTSGKSDG